MRATQFFEILGWLAGKDDPARLLSAPMQPLATDDVAAALADISTTAPANRMVELAGPESLSVAEFVGRYGRAGTSPVTRTAARIVECDPTATPDRTNARAPGPAGTGRFFPHTPPAVGWA